MLVLSYILRAGGVVLMILLVLLGTNENVLQFLGNVGGVVDGVGVWYNAISAFTQQDVAVSFFGTLTTVFITLMRCLAANFLDGLMLGILVQITENYIITRRQGLSAVFEVGNTAVVSFVGVLVLYVMKLNGEIFKTIMVGIVDIALLLVGIVVMCGGLRTKRTRYFLLTVMSDAFQVSGGIGIICTLLMTVTLLNNGVSFRGLLFLLVSLVAFSIVFRIADAARDLPPGPV